MNTFLFSTFAFRTSIFKVMKFLALFLFISVVFARNEFCKYRQTDDFVCLNDGENYTEIVVKLSWLENGCPTDLKGIQELKRKDPSKRDISKEPMSKQVRDICRIMDNLLNKKVKVDILAARWQKFVLKRNVYKLRRQLSIKTN